MCLYVCTYVVCMYICKYVCTLVRMFVCLHVYHAFCLGMVFVLVSPSNHLCVLAYSETPPDDRPMENPQDNYCCMSPLC